MSEIERVYLHVSDAKQFRDCRRRWFFGSPRMHNLTPIYPDKAFWLGIGIHMSLEYYYRSDSLRLGPGRTDHVLKSVQVFSDWSGKSLQDIHDRFKGNIDTSEWEALKEHRELGHNMLVHYFDTVQDDFRVRYTEQDFEMPLLYEGKPIHIRTKSGRVLELWISGRIDAIVEHPDGSWWLIEHKTARSISPQLTGFYALSDEQSGLYVYAAEEKYQHPIEGVLYNLLRKKAPVWPETLVNGGLTVRKNIDTTAAVYRQALTAAGIEHPEQSGYGEILRILEDKGNKFFYRDHVFRTKHEIKDLLTRFYHISHEMYDDPVIYPTPDMMKCPRCPFNPVCLAMASGADWQSILSVKFRPREDYEQAPDVVDIPTAEGS